MNISGWLLRLLGLVKLTMGAPPSLFSPEELQPSSFSRAASVASLIDLNGFCKLVPPGGDTFYSLRDSQLLLLFLVSGLSLILDMLDRHRNHSLKREYSIITRIMQVPTSDLKLIKDHSQVARVGFTLEITPHACCVGNLLKVAKVVNIIAKL